MIHDMPTGATPLDPDEAEGLKLTHVTSREELNRWEHDNIARADAKFARRRLAAEDLLSEAFLRKLHREMFDTVWNWAGRIRTTEKNIGVAPERVAVALRDLCEDTKTWIAYATYTPDEIAARFHHRLVAIHPFPNGNGRHARFATDLLLEKALDRPRFTWGGADLARHDDPRGRYLAALRAADGGEYAPLLAFVRA